MKQRTRNKEWNKLKEYIYSEILKDGVFDKVMNHHYNIENNINDYMANSVVDIIRETYLNKYQHIKEADEITDYFINDKYVKQLAKIAYVEDCEYWIFKSFYILDHPDHGNNIFLLEQMLIQDEIECLKCFIEVCSPYTRKGKINKIISKLK
jgi:hypothetical protein